MVDENGQIVAEVALPNEVFSLGSAPGDLKTGLASEVSGNLPMMATSLNADGTTSTTFGPNMAPSINGNLEASWSFMDTVDSAVDSLNEFYNWAMTGGGVLPRNGSEP